MASIAMIHGINSEHLGPHTRKTEWLPSLRDGIALSGNECPLPGESDIEVAFWGNLFRPQATAMGPTVPPYEPSDLDQDGERDLLLQLIRHAESVGDVIPTPAGVMSAGGPMWLHSAIQRLASTDFFRALYPAQAERMLIASLKQVHAYMNDESVYRRVQERVAAVIRPDTRVVIGHSLGSVIAYEALCRDPAQVVTLITLGSPLGIPTLIYDRLRPRAGWVLSGDQRVRVRPRVQHWFNFTERRDLVALVKRLSPLFERELHDYEIHTGRNDPHSIVKHLTDATVGRAICTAWP